jgi:hypothetical protein
MVLRQLVRPDHPVFLAFKARQAFKVSKASKAFKEQWD